MSKSISWHKEKLMARLTPRKKLSNIVIIQQCLGVRDYTTYVAIQSKKTDIYGNKPTYAIKPLIKGTRINSNFNIVHQALEELIDEGKLHSNMSFKEFKMQLALGTTPFRKISREA